MTDEHLRYEPMENGNYRVRPKPGYKLYCILTQNFASEAIIPERAFRFFRSEVEL